MSDATLANWTFERDSEDWIGRNAQSGRRTALKGSEVAARADAAAGRYVCRNWPECPHQTPEACTRAIAEQRRMKRVA